MKTEQILADAEVAAIYLRALIDKGVPMMAAVSLTSSYVHACRFTDEAKREPREPWQDPGT
ncbi:MAG TPA: hypothetical protein VIR54_22305 [Vicinamibacterales bacterium]|jgi:hypothetical protein